jgi:hypothetical protein
MLIPQNQKNFFIIKYNEWKYSIDIMFIHNEEVSLSNLFLILKSFTNNRNFNIKGIYICSKQNDEDKVTRIFHTIKNRKLMRFTFNDFIEWYEETYTSDWEYIKEQKYYGIRVVFYKESPFYLVGKIFPEYPWNPMFVKELIKDKTDFFYKNETLNLKEKYNKIIEENKKLKAIIKELQKKKKN